jgi:hypothetical protein
VSKRSFDLARTGGVNVCGACGAGFIILDRIYRIYRIWASRRDAGKYSG